MLSELARELSDDKDAAPEEVEDINGCRLRSHGGLGRHAVLQLLTPDVLLNSRLGSDGWDRSAVDDVFGACDR